MINKPLSPKDKIRLQLKKLWSQAHPDQISQMAEQAASQIFDLSFFGQAKSVLAYDALLWGELPFVSLLYHDCPQKTWLLPQISTTGVLSFHQIFHWSQLDSKPILSASPEDVSVADLILVPALALDQEGVRLGRGGGYYDRFLPTVPPSIITLSVVPDWAFFPNLPCQNHDFSVQHSLVVSSKIPT